MQNKYTYRVGWSEEDGAFVARCLEFPSLGAHGSSTEAALKEIQSVVEFCVNDMKKSGEEIPEPLGTKNFSGKFALRLPPEIHRQLTIESTEAGVSLNQFILSRLGGDPISRTDVVTKLWAHIRREMKASKAPSEHGQPRKRESEQPTPKGYGKSMHAGARKGSEAGARPRRTR